SAAICDVEALGRQDLCCSWNKAQSNVTARHILSGLEIEARHGRLIKRNAFCCLIVFVSLREDSNPGSTIRMPLTLRVRTRNIEGLAACSGLPVMCAPFSLFI